MTTAVVWAIGVASLATSEEIALPDITTTPITEVTAKHATFRAGVNSARGDHKGRLNTIVQISGEELELATAPNKKLFMPRARIEAIIGDGVAEPIALDKDLFHVGHVVGEEGSHVHLSLHPAGGLDGVLRRADGTKMVLSALARYSGISAPTHHDTVVYDVSDMTDEALAIVRGNFKASCPAANLNRSAILGYNTPERVKFETQFKERASKRSKRERRDDAVEHCLDSSGGRCSCSVGLVGDHFFYLGPHSQQNVKYGIQHMVNVLVEADAIYRGTNFGGVTGLGFVVHSAVIYPTTAGGNPTPGSNYPDGSTYLNAVTNGLRDRYTDACTALVFTHRDFHEGILGMAWVAETTGFGGICDPVFNCGFNTGINFGQIVTPFVASLVFAHEVGHNWGSEHDPTNCAPGDDGGGNYIMFAAASDGSKENNNKFSACSTAQMSTIIDLLREGCFVEAGVGCGDGEVSGDEECDCGDECTPTSCCTSDCRVNRQLYECSPQNPIRYPCCTLQCMYSSAGVKCHSSDECAEEAFCSGSNASCPLAPKEDNIPCRCAGDDCNEHPGTNPQVCERGVCHKFVCELYGGVQCGLSHPHSCELGCRGDGWGNGNECISTFDSSNTPAGFVGGRYYVAGTPCRKNYGRCDSNGECITIDTSDGVRARSPSQIFVENNWLPITAGVSVTLVVILALLHYRQYRIAQAKWRESERAYLLAAANAQAEASEERFLYDDDESSDGHSPDYAMPNSGLNGSQTPTAQHQNYMDVTGSTRV